MFGSRVVRDPAARGAKIRALVHSAPNADHVLGSGVEIVVADFDEPETLGPAFSGVDTAFLVSPMDDRIEARETNALRAAQTVDVRVVKLYGAVRHHGESLDALHLASIAAIRASGLNWALVSPN